jgi:hypothetical protein
MGVGESCYKVFSKILKVVNTFSSKLKYFPKGVVTQNNGRSCFLHFVIDYQGCNRTGSEINVNGVNLHRTGREINVNVVNLQQKLLFCSTAWYF